jgi:hypothetical protein
LPESISSVTTSSSAAAVVQAPWPTSPIPQSHLLDWTSSRHILEDLIVREQTRGKQAAAEHYTIPEDGNHSRISLEKHLIKSISEMPMDQERRLRGRLDRLNLDMVIMAEDGNCQVRVLSLLMYVSFCFAASYFY